MSDNSAFNYSMNNLEVIASSLDYHLDALKRVPGKFDENTMRIITSKLSIVGMHLNQISTLIREVNEKIASYGEVRTADEQRRAQGRAGMASTFTMDPKYSREQDKPTSVLGQDKPAVDAPAVDNPAVDAPAVDNPAVDNPAPMTESHDAAVEQIKADADHFAELDAAAAKVNDGKTVKRKSK